MFPAYCQSGPIIILVLKKGKPMELFKKLKFSAFSQQLLILLLSADTLYILLHVLNRVAVLKGIWPIFARDPFNVSFDLGIGESFQYAKELWCALLFAWLVIAKKKTAFTGWSLLFFYFLLDDMLSFHETMSVVVSNWLGLAAPDILVANLRVKDLGELAFSASVGLVFLLLLGIAYLRGNPGRRRIFHGIVIYLAVFLFFGVGLDIIDRFVVDSQFIKGAFTLAEDGGEMLTLSFLVAYLYSLPMVIDSKTTPLQ
jgi:hypothetical protein